MGYADSMNLYQAFGQSPQNFGDPMGLCLGMGDKPCSYYSQKFKGAVSDFVSKHTITGSKTEKAVGNTILGAIFMPLTTVLEFGSSEGELIALGQENPLMPVTNENMGALIQSANDLLLLAPAVKGATGLLKKPAAELAVGAAERPALAQGSNLQAPLSDVPASPYANTIFSGTEASAINPRLAQRFAAWKAYQARGGELAMTDWFKYTQGAKWGTAFETGYAKWLSSLESVHGNAALSSRTAFLYRMETVEGDLLKWGITQNLRTRYSSGFLLGKNLMPITSGSRSDMLLLERYLVETQAGPLNLEPWAGAGIR